MKLKHLRKIAAAAGILFNTACTPFSAQTSGSVKGLGRRYSIQSQLAAGELPSSFGSALQNSRYNPIGPVSRALVDGAREAHRIGMKTLKISMAREVLLTPTFYHLAELEGISQAELESRTSSLTDMARLKAYDYVLSMPFETIFIQTTEIGLADTSSHYWNMNTKPLSDAALEGIRRQHYDLAVYLLGKFKGSGRTFVLQDHEADWHASVYNSTTGTYGENTDVGHANYLKYWRARQEAVNNARQNLASDVQVYNMCEVVRLRESVSTGGKSLARDIIGQVSCDLVGYSAHDTALLGDGGVILRKAVDYIRSRARPSPTFGTNQVIISEIAVPETNSGGFYLQRKEEVVRFIAESIRAGMPWVIYWQLYDSQEDGNWLITPGNDFGLTFYNLLSNLGLKPETLAGRESVQAVFGPQPQAQAQAEAAPVAGAYESYFRSRYAAIFGRQPTQDTLNLFIGQYNRGAIGCSATLRDLAKEDPLRRSAQNLSDVAANSAYIYKMYGVAFNRNSLPGDNPQGLLSGRLGGTPLEEIDRVFYTHPEARDLCGSYGLRF